MLFGKRTKKESPSESLIRARHGREIKLVTRRDRASNNETVLGGAGVINVVGDELVILCNNDTVLRAPLGQLGAYELMNLSGINIVWQNESYVAYYTKGIENK